MVDMVKQGKKNRANGASFELRTRKDLEVDGWIVDKWSNNLELDLDFGGFKIHPAKRKWSGPGRPMAIGTGFPDFVAFRNISYEDEEDAKSSLYEAIGVECKCNGNLDKIEKEKCRWYLDSGTFGKILIAEKTKVKNKIVILYHDFEERYG